MKVAVSYSGGKDSIYLLLRAKQEGHDVLAISVDTGFLSRTGWRNMVEIPAKLKIDHIILREYSRFRSIYREHIPEIADNPFGICAACHGQIDRMVTECAKLYGFEETWSGMSPDEESLFPKGVMIDQCGECEFKKAGCCGKYRCAMGGKFITQIATCPLKKWLAPIATAASTLDDFRASTGLRTPLCEQKYDASAVVRAIREAGLKVVTSPIKTNCVLNMVIIHDYLVAHGTNPYAEFFASQPHVLRRLKIMTALAHRSGLLRLWSQRIKRQLGCVSGAASAHLCNTLQRAK